jgi:hypothetical protein
MDLAPDFDEFIGSLTAHGVEFVIVGAYALAFHGAPRFTKADAVVAIRLERSGPQSPAAGYVLSAGNASSGDLAAKDRLNVRPTTLHASTNDVTQRAVPPSMNAITTMSHAGL